MRKRIGKRMRRTEGGNKDGGERLIEGTREG